MFFPFINRIDLSSLTKTHAIPAFARKYQTSCANCHSAFPKLNSFGVAFRLNGYQFPEDEEEKVKEEPVILGAEAYKRIWPRAIWPGSIPGTTPIAFRINSGFSYDTTDPNTPTEFTLPSIQVFMAGSFNERISFFGSILLAKGHNTNALQMSYIRLNDLFSRFIPKDLLNLSIGQFIPDLTTYKNKHRSLTHSLYAINTYVPRNGSSLNVSHKNFGISGQGIGMEASGLITKRLRYVLGMTNGRALWGKDNDTKDFHGKIAFKLGGMAFDGSSTGDIFGSSGNNWAEKSVIFTLFGYSGSRLDDNDKDVSLLRLGGDINLNFRNLNVVSGFITGTDEEYYNPTGVTGKVKFERQYDLFFSEASYMIYPWLIGILRYEQVNPYDIHFRAN